MASKSHTNRLVGKAPTLLDLVARASQILAQAITAAYLLDHERNSSVICGIEDFENQIAIAKKAYNDLIIAAHRVEALAVEIIVQADKLKGE